MYNKQGPKDWDGFRPMIQNQTSETCTRSLQYIRNHPRCKVKHLTFATTLLDGLGWRTSAVVPNHTHLTGLCKSFYVTFRQGEPFEQAQPWSELLSPQLESLLLTSLAGECGPKFSPNSIRTLGEALPHLKVLLFLFSFCLLSLLTRV